MFAAQHFPLVLKCLENPLDAPKMAAEFRLLRTAAGCISTLICADVMLTESRAIEIVKRNWILMKEYCYDSEENHSITCQNRKSACKTMHLTN